MKRILLEGPAVEPVLLAEAKAHLRLDDAAEDDLVRALIAAARVAVETDIRRVLIAQRWRAVVEDWPAEPLVLPVGPALSLQAVRAIGPSGAAITLDPEETEFDPADGSVRLLGAVPRAERYQVDFTAGFGTSGLDVPQPLRQAIRLLVTHWFEHRAVASMSDTVAVMPHGYRELVMPYRRIVLC